jgi:inosine-uridine nucleoside N-ribohydrolase
MRVCVVDVDAGVDDAQALVAVLRSAEVRSGELRVLGITCVAGNVPVESVVANVCVVLEACEAEDVPVFVGCHRPLVRRYSHAKYWHGEDGLGGCRHKFPASDRFVREESAVEALWRLAREHPGRLEVLALGPLTNLAVALRLHPELPRQLRRLVIMGGTGEMVGNVSASVEYNFHADPEAARAVLQPEGFGGGLGERCVGVSGEEGGSATWDACGLQTGGSGLVEVVPWETVDRHSLSLEWCRAEWLSGESSAGRMLSEVSEDIFGKCVRFGDGESYAAADALAAAVLVRGPSLVSTMLTRAVTVDCGGGPCHGALVVDRRKEGLPPCDRARFVSYDKPVASSAAAASSTAEWELPTENGVASIVHEIDDALFRELLVASTR